MGKDHTLYALEEGHVRFAVRGRRTLRRPKRVVEVKHKPKWTIEDGVDGLDQNAEDVKDFDGLGVDMEMKEENPLNQADEEALDLDFPTGEAVEEHI